MEIANITYQDAQGNFKVKVDRDKCIVCGRCVSACKHSARFFEDDTKQFIADLKAGQKISVIVAPSIKTNIPAYKKLFTFLKSLGVNYIYDASLGADICIWAQIKYLKENPKPVITQPCPAIVTYCEMYHHDLLKRLSPVHSPMACISIYMKYYQGIEDEIAALTPCMAKTDEFADTNLARYNVTFSKLLEYMEENQIVLPEEERAFDHEESGLGALFPMPGGLKENIEYFMGKQLYVLKAEGTDIYEKLETYGQTADAFLPDIFDVLNCGDGCNLGTAYAQGRNLFEIDKVMNDTRKETTAEQKRAHYEAVYRDYDARFDLSRFLRVYKPVVTHFPEVTEEDIQEAFVLMGKYNSEQKNVDCSACGSATCLHMARKIVLGVNIPENCIVKSKEDAKSEHEKNMQAHVQLAEAEKLHEADKRLQLLLGATPTVNFLFDSNFRLIDCNPMAVKFMGFATKEELFVGFFERIVKSIPKYQSDGRLSVSLEDRLKMAVVEGFVHFETDLILDGVKRVIDVEMRKVPYEGSFAIVGYIYDLTEAREREVKLLEAQNHTKEMMMQLEKTMSEAQAASQAKSTFLSTMSHEIRTPLNAIIGMTGIAGATDEIERKDYAIGKIKDASKHLLGVINDILDMSKIEADRFELSYVHFEFEKMIQNVVDVVNFRMDEKQLQFSVCIDQDLPRTVIGDDQRLAQVMTNLLSNAVKFTPEKGSIRLCASLRSKKEDVCCFEISVEDTGIGIVKEEIPRLFQSFEQAESQTTRKFGGTGLGLAISKRIVELMGGKIWVTSELGKGSKFSFYVFVGYETNAENMAQAQEMVISTGESGEESVADFSGCTLLLVEDVEINREIVMALLEPTNLTIECAKNGEQALHMFRENPETYNIIFMDIQMPVMDGYEATRQIRRLHVPTAKTIPIIAMTANVFKEDVERCLEAGMDAHLGKPIDFNEVMTLLRRGLQK